MFCLKQLVFLVALASCAKTNNTELATLNPPDPLSTANQLSGSDVSYQIIVTVKEDHVIDDLLEIQQIEDSVDRVTFWQTTNDGYLKLYVVRLKAGLDPRRYIRYFERFPGVEAAKRDGQTGQDDHS